VLSVGRIGMPHSLEVNWRQIFEEEKTILDNLVLIAVIIILMWLAAIGYYIYLSRQQRDLADEIRRLREMLGKSQDEGELD
jgi:hypothetical protein